MPIRPLSSSKDFGGLKPIDQVMMLVELVCEKGIDIGSVFQALG